MKASGLALPLLAALAVLLPACRHAEVKPVSDGCAAFPLVVQPVNLDTAILEEEQYRPVLKQVADGLALGLRDRLGELHKFQRVDLAAACSAGFRVETRVVSLIHKSRKFHYRVAGRVLECGTDRLLHTFETQVDNKDAGALADGLADDITDEVKDDVVCVPPPPAPHP